MGLYSFLCLPQGVFGVILRPGCFYGAHTTPRAARRKGDKTMTGTIANAAAIVAGGLVGVRLKKGMRPGLDTAIEKTLGVSIVILGLNGVISAMFTVNSDGSLASSGELLLILSLVLGTLAGELLDIDGRLGRFGERVEKRIGTAGFGAAFITGSLIYCVGAMAIVGSLNDGLLGDPSVLYVKSLLDGISAVVLGATMGVGVCFSALPILVYQGAITLLSGVLAPYLQGALLSQLCMVGYAMVACIGLNFISRSIGIKTANLLPGLLVPVLWQLFSNFR